MGEIEYHTEMDTPKLETYYNPEEKYLPGNRVTGFDLECIRDEEKQIIGGKQNDGFGSPDNKIHFSSDEVLLFGSSPSTGLKFGTVDFSEIALSDMMQPNNSQELEKPPQLERQITSSASETKDSSIPSFQNPEPIELNYTYEPESIVDSTIKTITSPAFAGDTESMEPTRNLNKFEDFCIKIIPRINIANSQTYGEILVEVLREYLRSVPLEEFYQLIYHSTTPWPEHNTISSMSDAKDSITLKGKQDGLKIFSFVLKVFGLPYMTNSTKLCKFVENKLLRSINFYEFLRTFLAIKILFDSIDEVDERIQGQHVIPRILIHKAYCLVCKKLTAGYIELKKNSKFHDKIVVGISQIGRIMKLVYPNLKVKRLGRRGSSIYHYLGMKWNKSIIDASILGELELDKSRSIVPRLKVEKIKKKPKNLSKEKKLSRVGIVNEEESYNFPPFIENEAPLYSFVSISTKFPDTQCSPRSWDIFPGIIPKPSQWATRVILTSLKALLKYGLNIHNFVENIEQHVFAVGDLNTLLESFIGHIEMFINANAGKEAYMNLYLTVLLSLFPIVLASDEEVPREAQAQLRKNLTVFHQNLRLQIRGLSEQESDHLTNFSHIIRKMIHISEMALSRIPTNLVEIITKDIVMDFLRPSDAQSEICGTINEDIIFNAVIIAMKAYKSFFGEGITTLEEKNDTILGIIRAFRDFSTASKSHLVNIKETISTQALEQQTFDLPFQIFKTLTKLFHEICLSNPVVLDLPIQFIKFLLLKRNKDIQNFNFPDLVNRDREVAREKFKTWWIYSTLSGEYLQIIAEIVSIIDKLS